jgi:hypothetical protein
VTHAPLLFAASVIVLLVAHACRALRQSFLFSPRELSGRFDLLLGLAIGYVINAIVPFRLGELFRAGFVAKRERLRVAYVLASVAAERLSDLVIIALMGLVLASRSEAMSRITLGSAGILLGAALCLLGVALLIEESRLFRRVVWRAGSVFNDEIRASLVEAIWQFARYVRNGSLVRLRYLVATVVMWGLYLSSYWLFARSMDARTIGVALDLLGAPLRPLAAEIVDQGASGMGMALFVFTSLPVALVLAYGLVRDRRAISDLLQIVRRLGSSVEGDALMSMSERFRNRGDFAALLSARFTASREIVTSFADETMGEVVVHRILPGGSEAVTAVVETRGNLSIRKVATGRAAEKLTEQVQWLRRHATDLPLPGVLGEAWHGARFHYDMPFNVSASDFYDVIHAAPIERSQGILREIVSAVGEFHTASCTGSADDAAIATYLEQKVTNNAREILAFVSDVLPEEYSINGEAYRLSEFQCLSDREWLRGQIRSRGTCVVHGDLTIENIVATLGDAQAWYLIDPNATNLFDTPLLDWAKLMQSLHLGYEVLNRGAPCIVSGGAIRIPFVRSSAYARLHGELHDLLLPKLGPEGMREVAFHELVHYLRLIPYKIRSDPQKGLTFFACAAVLLRQYCQTNA